MLHFPEKRDSSTGRLELDVGTEVILSAWVAHESGSHGIVCVCVHVWYFEVSGCETAAFSQSIILGGN